MSSHQPDGKRYQNINFDFFREAIREAGLEEDTHFHDLRHTAASHHVMSGVDLATLKEILGHKDISMTLRYSHLAPNHKRKAMENLGEIFRMDTYMDTKEVGTSSRRGPHGPSLSHHRTCRSAYGGS